MGKGRGFRNGGRVGIRETVRVLGGGLDRGFGNQDDGKGRNTESASGALR